MNFPLFVPTYEINGCIYRRNIQGIQRLKNSLNYHRFKNFYFFFIFIKIIPFLHARNIKLAKE